MVFLRSLRKKKRFRNKSRNKNGRKMRQIGGDGYQSFSFTNRPLTLFERLFGRQQQQSQIGNNQEFIVIQTQVHLIIIN